MKLYAESAEKKININNVYCGSSPALNKLIFAKASTAKAT